MNLEELYNRLFKGNEDVRLTIESARLWRKQIAREYMLMGCSFDQSNILAWKDYWKMMNEENGFEVSFHEIGDVEDEV